MKKKNIKIVTKENMIRIDCISDLHGYFPELYGGDLLIIAGDLTARHTLSEFNGFYAWLKELKYGKKIIVPGNHDSFFINANKTDSNFFSANSDFDLLIDSGTEFEGLKIWGSPWTTSSSKLNPKCKAFTGSEDLLREKFDKIPNDTDILVTHSPPFGILDSEILEDGSEYYIGSTSLRDKIMRIKPRICVFGHFHNSHVNIKTDEYSTYVNASIVDKNYIKVNNGVQLVYYYEQKKVEELIKKKEEKK